MCLLEVGPDARFLLIHLAPRCTVALLRIKPYEGALPLRFHDKPVELHLMWDITVVFRADELRAGTVDLAEELDQVVGLRSGRPAAR
ncbi:hypothetical protein ADL03_33195 [Nocardia sp. NRRL S-836]|nr:hypothetical protein ADL03_33195 [Nocardia sp. NRRL S-836]